MCRTYHYLGILTLCMLIFYCHSTKESEEMPKYVVNLDEPAEKRWTNVLHDFTAYAPFLRTVVKERIPSDILPLAEKVALYLDTLFEEPYPGELRSVAEAGNLTLAEAILGNMAYDLTAYCTSIVAQDVRGNVFHARNLDYDYADSLRKLSVHIDFQRNGNTIYSGITFAGYIGILTGQKPHAFTVSLDERDKGYIWENILQLLLAKTTPIGFLLRSLLANEESDYNYAVQKITSTEMIAPAYIIIGGINQGVVVTRARIEAIDVWKLNASQGRWFLVETNYDHWVSPPPSDDRRDVAINAMEKMGRQNITVEGLFQVMSTKLVLSNTTTFTCIMSAKYPSLFSVWRRKCCH